MNSLLLFFRDLRLEDHTALYHASLNNNVIIPIFIFTPEQASESNKYKSESSFSYMISSLQELDHEIKNKGGKLHCFYGEIEDILKGIITKNPIQSIYCHYDYTPYAIKREEIIKKICKKFNIEANFFHDYLLTEPGKILKKDKKPYTKFTPFYHQALLNIEGTIQKHTKFNFYKNKLNLNKEIDITKEFTPKGEFFKEKQKTYNLNGGRKEALILLKNFNHYVSHYGKDRDCLTFKTSLLSAPLKFGVISVREIYNQYKKHQPFIRQLLWRDFFTHIAFHFPHVFKGAFNKKLNDINWKNNKKLFTLWCEGNTGFPLIDAAMRQLNETGYMPNRARLATASLLVKNLHISWQWGEKYFAQKLVEYDPSVNNGNWQWVAGTGCDNMPYFRIFNPWIQQKKFDPDAEYIKTWLPELKQYSAREIHNHFKNNLKDYLPPCVDYSDTSKEYINTFKKL